MANLPSSKVVADVVAKGTQAAVAAEQARQPGAPKPGDVWSAKPPSPPPAPLPTTVNEVRVALVKDAAAKVGEADGALATVGAAMGTVTAAEQAVSSLLSAIPFPRFPALRVTDTGVGLPHAHMHPPNLIPPAPPVPLPSMGPVMYIPFLSGASKVLINGMPAARCGDLGLGIWCGGYFPLYEIFLGSSNVWIEGARASRMGVDITKHCIFTTPRPNDPPLGPMVGTTITGSPTVLIGGIPMPSLTSMAMGLALKVAFKGVAKIAGAVKAFSRKAAAEVSGQLSRKVAYLSQGDPARRVMGAATKSHPEEIAKMRKAMEEAGVEVRERTGAMAYSPGLKPGEPGQFFIDPDASFSAWTHEHQHFLDDKAAGWGGMRDLFDNDLRWTREQAAYGKEIEMMENMGHKDVANDLRELMEAERMYIYGK
jgi:uncharacterized Zn-binding protein involved in type VI secretion